MPIYRKNRDLRQVKIIDTDGTELLFIRDGENALIRIKPKNVHIDDAEAAYVPMEWVLKAILDIAKHGE